MLAVRTLDDAAIAIYTDHIGAPTILDESMIGQLVDEAIAVDEWWIGRQLWPPAIGKRSGSCSPTSGHQGSRSRF